jgi:hypothetical protein
VRGGYTETGKRHTGYYSQYGSGGTDMSFWFLLYCIGPSDSAFAVLWNSVESMLQKSLAFRVLAERIEAESSLSYINRIAFSARHEPAAVK